MGCRVFAVADLDLASCADLELEALPAPLEVLHFALVLHCCFSGIEGAQILAFALRVLLA